MLQIMQKTLRIAQIPFVLKNNSTPPKMGAAIANPIIKYGSADKKALIPDPLLFAPATQKLISECR